MVKRDERPDKLQSAASFHLALFEKFSQFCILGTAHLAGLSSSVRFRLVGLTLADRTAQQARYHSPHLADSFLVVPEARRLLKSTDTAQSTQWQPDWFSLPALVC